jgi:hypothetical protein
MSLTALSPCCGSRPSSRGKNRALPMVLCFNLLELLRAAAQTPSLVCRPSSQALRLQVPLPSTARAPRLTFMSLSPSSVPPFLRCRRG